MVTKKKLKTQSIFFNCRLTYLVFSSDMYYDCSIGSPQLLLDELPDASYVSKLVEPITKTKIDNFGFQMDFVEQQLLPGIKTIIKQGKKSTFSTIPALIRLILDNFGEESFGLIKNELHPIIISTILTGGPRKAQDVTDLFIEICSMIPRHFREDFVVDLIHKYSLDKDIKLRLLAVHLIPIVRDSDRVFDNFSALAHDSNPTIRGTIVSNLSNYTFEEDVIVDVIKDAISDPCIGVQQMAANIFGSIAPNLSKEFCQLLENPETVRNAFPSMPQVVAHTSFAEIFDSFLAALAFDKNDAALALLETVQSVPLKSEESLYIRAAKSLISFSPFAWRLHSFAQSFTDKSSFVELLDPSHVSDWRTRYALLKQCQEFLDDLDLSSLIRLAEIFSEDQIAYIRNESVNLWVAILKKSIGTKATVVDRLMRGSWQKRMVLAKVIGIHGKEGFNDIVELLQNDPVENVRHCISTQL